MDDQAYLELSKKVKSWGEESESKKISELEKLLGEAIKDVAIINSFLSSAYQDNLMLEKAEDAYRFEVKLTPDEPIAWSMLVEFLIFVKEDYKEAKIAGEIALEKARSAGRYVRLMLINLARIARKSKDYLELKNLIEAILDYEPIPGGRDVGFEADFIVDLPPGTIESELLKKYRLAQAAQPR